MSTDIKLNKAQISYMIQSGGSISSWLANYMIQSGGSWLANLGKKALTNVAIPLARDNFPGLVSNLTSNAINKSGEGAVRAGKGFALFILNEDMNDIIKIIK